MANDKFQKYGKLAEYKFVEEFKTIVLISEELPVTEKTLRNWKKAGNWEEKKNVKFNQLKSIGSKLYQAAEKILDRFLLFLEDPAQNEQISDIEERILRDALSKLPTFSKFEQAKQEAGKKKVSTKTPEEKLDKVLERFL